LCPYPNQTLTRGVVLPKVGGSHLSAHFGQCRMRDVMAYVHTRVEEQHANLFLPWLRNESVPARDRLSRWLCDAIVARWTSELRVATENRMWSMLALPRVSSAERVGT